MSESNELERMRILERIERGEINAAEGMRLLDGLRYAEAASAAEVTLAAEGHSTAKGMPDVDVLEPATSPVTDQDMERWKRWWRLPFAIGTAIVILAGLLMLSAIQASGYGFWFTCLWVPFLIGVAAMALSWASRTARWLHVRIHNTKVGKRRRSFGLSFPVPLRFTAWLLRVIGPHVPQLQNTALDEFVLALNDNTGSSSHTPLYVDVDEGEGERVQVYFG